MRNTRITMLLPLILVSMTVNAVKAIRVEIPPAIAADVKTLGCNACHGLNQTKFGPSWQDVADRYRGQNIYEYRGYKIDGVGEKLPLVQGLVKKISKGGKGEWNEYIPMVQNDPNGAHTKEIKTIVNFILTIPPSKYR